MDADEYSDLGRAVEATAGDRASGIEIRKNQLGIWMRCGMVHSRVPVQLKFPPASCGGRFTLELRLLGGKIISQRKITFEVIPL